MPASERVVIVGGGAHALSVGTLLMDEGYAIDGYIDRVATSLSWAYLGDDDAATIRGPRGQLLAMGLGFDAAIRSKVFERYSGAGFSFLTFVHPRATVASNARLGEGCVIYPNCFIGAEARLGRNVTVCANSSIDHNCQIGDHCYISPAVAIPGSTILGPSCAVGINATFMEGIRIERSTIVGAATLMLKDVDAPGRTFVGSPSSPLNKV